jgi:hypothetical protein
MMLRRILLATNKNKNGITTTNLRRFVNNTNQHPSLVPFFERSSNNNHNSNNGNGNGNNNQSNRIPSLFLGSSIPLLTTIQGNNGDEEEVAVVVEPSTGLSFPRSLVLGFQKKEHNNNNNKETDKRLSLISLGRRTFWGLFTTYAIAFYANPTRVKEVCKPILFFPLHLTTPHDIF